jgi:hypothetical protein
MKACLLLPADIADERRKPISENLRNLREAFLLPDRKAFRQRSKRLSARYDARRTEANSLSKTDA